eukprot:6169834-Pleurochrysis_carterae.AAC.1
MSCVCRSIALYFAGPDISGHRSSSSARPAWPGARPGFLAVAALRAATASSARFECAPSCASNF